MMNSEFKLIILLMFNNLVHCIAGDINALCSETFCKSYLIRNKCNALSDSCRIQNSTHNGVFLPYPGPCNCCDYCLENLGKGVKCAKGDPSSPQPTAMCGPSLSCQLSENIATCEKMSSPCIQEQDEYDKARVEGTLGHLQLRPVCDRNGFYAPFACIPGEICYCVSKDGRRLFGEISYTTQPEYLLKCKCSRSYDEALKHVHGTLHTPEHLRCQSQGDFDAIQCIDGGCLCTDTEDGHPTYRDVPLVNISAITEVTLKCFNSKVHTDGSYYQKCESEYIEQLNKIRKYEREGYAVFGYDLPNCQLDGFYAPVQYKDNVKFCSSPSGEKLENFEVQITDPSSLTMNCKCARARSLIVGEEKPVCCKNGNYKEMQCRRGLCRCVNENGMQIEKEVDYTDRQKLKCFKNACEKSMV